MINTSRISSGFDVELQLGANWFRTALELLNEHKLLGPPGLPIIITDVQISFEEDWDLQINVFGLEDPVFARAELSEDGNSLTLTTSLPAVPPKTIPFGVLQHLSAPPTLKKRRGDADHENVIAILANLDIHAEDQDEEPRDLRTDPLPRGVENAALSFLPKGKDIAFGMPNETYARFANNIWHTQLRAEDGTHPLPDKANKRGDWSKVTMNASGGKIQIKLEGDIPVDSPIIDVVPDPHVTITLNITPVIENGVLRFTIEPETDVDTGLLGDIFGAIAGGLGGGIVGGVIGFIVGLVTGGMLGAILAGLLIGAGIGLVVGVIVIEVAEVIVEGMIQKEIKATIDGKPVADLLCQENGIVRVATPVQEGGFNLSVLDSIPASVPISTINPVDEFLYKQILLVTSVYDDITVNGDGFAVAGLSSTAEKFLPEVVTIKSFNYEDEVLDSITYRRSDGKQQTLAIEEVFERSGEAELKAPFKLFAKPENASLRIPGGKLACVTLKPIAIHSNKSIVQQIQFDNGLRLDVDDAIRLQDSAAIIVTGFQLIHPKDYNPYFRAKADFVVDNNFESLPEF